MDNKKEFLEKFGNKITNIVDKKQRLYFDVKNENLHEIVDHLFNGMGCRLSTATAFDSYRWVEVLYQFSHDESGQYFCPRVKMTDKDKPRMNSITPIVKGAEWIEREMAEYWDITFDGHPRPEPLLIKDHPNYEVRRNQFRIRSVDHE